MLVVHVDLAFENLACARVNHLASCRICYRRRPPIDDRMPQVEHRPIGIIGRRILSSNGILEARIFEGDVPLVHAHLYPGLHPLWCRRINPVHDRLDGFDQLAATKCSHVTWNQLESVDDALRLGLVLAR